MARQILSVTEILIAEIGIQNLSMRKIATRANLALGTLYLYFKTKDDLLNKLAYDLCDRFTHYVQDEQQRERLAEAFANSLKHSLKAK